MYIARLPRRLARPADRTPRHSAIRADRHVYESYYYYYYYYYYSCDLNTLSIRAHKVPSKNYSVDLELKSIAD
jgi:hypothetical protein